MTLYRVEVLSFLRRRYDSNITEKKYLRVIMDYLGKPYFNIRYRFNIEVGDAIEIVGTDIHEYIEAAEIERIFKRIIPVDRKSKDWQGAYKITHPTAIRLEALYYREKDRADLAEDALSRKMEVFD